MNMLEIWLTVFGLVFLVTALITPFGIRDFECLFCE